MLTDHSSVSWCGYLHCYVCGGASDFLADHVGFGAFHSRIWAVLQHGHGSGNRVIHCAYCTCHMVHGENILTAKAKSNVRATKLYRYLSRTDFCSYLLDGFQLKLAANMSK